MHAGCAQFALVLACLQGASRPDRRIRLDGTGLIDVRWVHASGDASFLDGGLGNLRFDSDHEDLRLGRAFLAHAPRLASATNDGPCEVFDRLLAIMIGTPLT